MATLFATRPIIGSRYSAAPRGSSIRKRDSITTTPSIPSSRTSTGAIPQLEKLCLYRRGVAGFRLDAVDTLFEDAELRDNPIRPGLNSFGQPNMEPKYTSKLPEVHDV